MKTGYWFLFVLNLITLGLFAEDQIDRMDKNIALIKLTSQVYLIQTSYACNGNLNCNHLLIVDSTDIVLVNTPSSDSLTSILLLSIEKKFGKKVSKVIVSHFHDDSSGGLTETARHGIIAYSLDKTSDLLKNENKNIDVVFTDSLSIPLQTIQLKMYFQGAGHSIDNSVVWLPAEKILFGGCLLKSLDANGPGNIQDADLKAWPKTVRNVRQKFSQANIVIPGHMAIGDTSIFNHTINILEKK